MMFTGMLDGLRLLLAKGPDKPHVALGMERSGKWPAFRDDWLRRNNSCIVCGTEEHLEVHHIEPFHLKPQKELDPTNVCTMCRTPSHPCHWIWGHFFDWKLFNPKVLVMSSEYARGLHFARMSDTLRKRAETDKKLAGL